MKRILLIFIFFPILSFSQEFVTLKQLVQRGIEHNYKLRIVRNEQTISDNNVNIGNAGFLPAVSLNSNIGGSKFNNTQFPQNESESINYQKNVSNQNFGASVNLNWTVFDGFNMQAKYSGLKELQKIGELKTRISIESFISDLSAEYYNYIQQLIRLNNLKAAVKLSKERLRIVDARYLIGNLSRLDLQQARVDFNTDSSKLIRQHEILYASRIKLNKYVGEQDVEKQLFIKDTLITLNTLLDKESLWVSMLQKNAYFQMAEKEKNLKVLDLQIARSSNYPYLKFNAGYGYSDNLYEVGTYKRQNNLGLNYGVTLGINIFDGFNNLRKQRNVQIEIQNKELWIEDLKLSLKSDFSNYWMAYVNNLELTNLEIENVSNARENYEIAIERYKLGDLSGIELREAQNSLLEAEERLVQSEFYTKLCEISLFEISGEIVNNIF